jgi:hypothetical protein
MVGIIELAISGAILIALVGLLIIGLLAVLVGLSRDIEWLVVLYFLLDKEGLQGTPEGMEGDKLH